LSSNYSVYGWQLLTSPASQQYSAFWAPYLFFALICELTLLTVSLLLSVLFFQKRRAFPALYISVLAAGVAIAAIDFAAVKGCSGLLSENRADPIRDLVRTASNAIIWAAYFIKSKRVRATFIN
jgi:hypothetical protein